MRVIIAGGHGKIAIQVERLLAQRGDTAIGLIRNPDHAGDLKAVGAEPLVLDLEKATVDKGTKIKPNPRPCKTMGPITHVGLILRL